MGDLLGRERVTGAKKTRLGCDSPVERFENIIEMPCPVAHKAILSFSKSNKMLNKFTIKHQAHQDRGQNI